MYELVKKLSVYLIIVLGSTTRWNNWKYSLPWR